MKSINSYLRSILILTLIAVWGVSGIAYATGSGHSDHDDYDDDTPEIVIPSCPFDAQDGRTIVTFNSDETHWLLSNKTATEAQLAPVSTTLPAGKYTISLFSYDGYAGRDEVTQSDESWFVILKNGGTEVTRSSAVSDLEDYVNVATRNETVDVGLTVSSDVDSVVAYHAAYPSNKKFPNSVAPICAAFDKIPEPPAPTPTKGSITVCKAIVDAEGNLTDGSAVSGSFSVAGIDFAGNKTAPKAVGVLPTSQFSTPLSFTADIFGHDSVNDAQCVTYGDLKMGSYFYDEEGISGEGWLAPKYNDQFKTSVHNINDFFDYSDEIFTPDLSDDSSRNTNSDGHIILNKTRPNRTLVVLNEMAPAPVNEKPVITLVGDNPLEVIIGTTFTDPGATAEDTEDGDISGQIVVGGDIVDTSELGSYTITYNVVDSQGAAADQVTRTVNVVSLGDTECSDAIDNDGDELIDDADPTCHTDGNADNPDSYDENINDENAKPVIALVGEDPVSVTQGSSYADQGATASDEEDGDITEDIVVGGDTVDTNTIGTYTITYNVVDSQGAAADEVTRTVEVVSGGTNGGGEENPACSDALDNDEDGLIDTEDPACHTDGDAENSESYDGEIDNENSKPIITLIGTATSTVTVGGTFTDPGATASDEEDGDITEDIVVGGDTVDTNTIGTYTITYNVVDSQGAAADEVTRTITVEGGTGGDTGEPEPTPTPTNGGGGGSVGGNGPIATGGGGGVPPTLALTTTIATTTSPDVATSTPAVCSEYLLDYIKLGADNNTDEVKKLEAFLNTFEGFDLPVDGVYNQADFDAVSIFQNRYFTDVLAPWGYDAPTGYVYYTTRKKVNEIYCERAFPLTDEQSAEVTAFKAFLESLKSSGAPREDIDNAASGQVGFDTSTTTGPELALGDETNVNDSTELAGDGETQQATGLTAQFARAFDALTERVSSKAIGAGLIILGILLGAAMFYNRRGKTPNTTKKA